MDSRYMRRPGTCVTDCFGFAQHARVVCCHHWVWEEGAYEDAYLKPCMECIAGECSTVKVLVSLPPRSPTPLWITPQNETESRTYFRKARVTRRQFTELWRAVTRKTGPKAGSTHSETGRKRGS